MSSAKLDAVNELIAVARQLRDHVMETPDLLRDGTSPDEIVRRDVGLRLSIVHAAKTLNATAADPEADKVVGPMLLERIDKAADAKSDSEWVELAQAALDASVMDEGVDQTPLTTWMDQTTPLVTTAQEAVQRAEDQGIEIMLEGMRQGVEQAPGIDMRFTEVVDGQVIKDEQVLGPTPGEEDTPEVGTGRLDHSKQALLGLDDGMTSVDVERVIVRESAALLERHGLSSQASAQDVEHAVAERVYRALDEDIALAKVTGALPEPVQGLTTAHLSALRITLLSSRYQSITQGSVRSRALRGDRSAQGVMHQLIVLADMLVASDPYFLPAGRITASPVDARSSLEPGRTFLVWHDEPIPVAGDLRVLTWMFSTNEQGRLDDIARIVMVDDNGLDDGWCSLTSGPASTVAQAVASTLTESSWETAKRLRLPGKPESSEWTKALVRSRGRARRGGVHQLRTLSDS